MIAQILTIVATVATAVLVLRARRSIEHTTLGTAWTWAVIAALGWCVAAIAATVIRPAVAEQLWYVAVVVTLCPWIAVLGARRPTVRVWNWFVVVPLLAVLLWPVALCWMPRGPDRLTLATPHLIGFGLVLLMGTGNFLGTRFTVLAVMTCLAEGLLVLSLRTDSRAGEHPWLRALPAFILFQGVMQATAARGAKKEAAGWNGLWKEFRNTFGIVWANRLAERVNSEAVKGDWKVRLQPQGFISVDPDRPVDPETAQIDQTSRWLLRRFVDDPWIEAGLAHAAPGLKDGGSLAGKDSIDASSTSS